MSYKITIQKLVKTTETVFGEWVTIDTEEVSRESYSTDAEPTRIKNIFGYAPDVTKRVIEKRDVLIQEVDELDLAKVIKAINNLD